MNVNGSKYGVKESILKDFERVILQRKFKMERSSRLTRTHFPYQKDFCAKKIIYQDLQLSDHEFGILVTLNTNPTMLPFGLSYLFQFIVQSQNEGVQTVKLVKVEFQDLVRSDINGVDLPPNGTTRMYQVTISKNNTTLELILDTDNDSDLTNTFRHFVPGMEWVLYDSDVSSATESEKSDSDSDVAIVPSIPITNTKK